MTRPALLLTRLGAGPVSGSSPGLGTYDGWAVAYEAAGTAFNTSVRYYPKGGPNGLFVFQHDFPAGAAGLNVTAAVNASGAAPGEFASSQVPSSAYPAFVAAAAPPPLGFVTWTGRFAGVSAGAGAGLSAVTGAEGGPLLVYAVEPAANVGRGAGGVGGASFPTYSSAP